MQFQKFVSLSKKKARLLLLAILAVGSLLAVSAGISQLEISQNPLSPLTIDFQPDMGSGDNADSKFLRYGVAVFLVIGVLGVVYYFVLSSWRAKLAAIGFVLAMVLLIINMDTARFEPSTGESVQAGGGQPALETIVVSGRADAPEWVAVTVGAVIWGLLAAGFVLLRRRMKKPDTAMETVADKAQNTIAALESGADFKTVILRCYYQMVKALEAHHDLHRSKSMTPREFETHLAAAGFATDDVRRLTRMFETVRYGGRDLSHSQEQQALEALKAFVRFCGEGETTVRRGQ